MDIKNKIAEIITLTHKTPLEQAEEIVQLFAEDNDYKQLLQSRVVGECVIHSTDWHGKCFICDKQVFTREDD